MWLRGIRSSFDLWQKNCKDWTCRAVPVIRTVIELIIMPPLQDNPTHSCWGLRHCRYFCDRGLSFFLPWNGNIVFRLGLTAGRWLCWPRYLINGLLECSLRLLYILLKQVVSSVLRFCRQKQKHSLYECNHNWLWHLIPAWERAACYSSIYEDAEFDAERLFMRAN